MLKRFLLASAMLLVPLTTFAQNATTQVNGAILNGTPTTILTPWVPNGDGTYSQKVSATTGGGSNAAAGPVNTTAPASASYTGFLSGANIVPVSATNPLPISGTISATTTANATAAAPTYTSGSNPLSVDFAGNLRVGGTFYQATQPVSAAALPLPTGAATSALQTTINTTLGTPFQAGGSVGITGTPAVKVSDTAGTGITSTLLAGKQRLDVTLAAGGAPGATASIVADQVGGVDGGGLLRALSVDTGGRVNVQGGNATAVKTDGSAVTQPVSLAALPALTTGAAVIGGVTMADGSNVTQGAQADAAWTTGNGSLIALLKALDRDTLLSLPAGAAIIGTTAQGSAFSTIDQNATAFAGAGSVLGTMVVSPRTSGAVITANINVSALTLGTATSVFAILQESPDGINFTDIWVSDPITATGNYRVPAVQIAGRRRWRFFSVGGTSTTVTATITASELPSGYPLMRQMRDAYAATNPFATMYNGVALTASNFQLTVVSSLTAPFYIEGCKNVTVFITLTGSPTVTTQPIMYMQLSMDGINYAAAGILIGTPTGNGTFTAVTSNNSYKFARILVATAAVYSAGSYTITNIGVQAVN